MVRAAKPKVKSNFAAFRDEMMRRKLQAATAKTSLDEKPETAVATDPDAVTSGKLRRRKTYTANGCHAHNGKTFGNGKSLPLNQFFINAYVICYQYILLVDRIFF